MKDASRIRGPDTEWIKDIITGNGRPTALLRHPISKLPGWYTKMFLTMIERSGSDRSLVQAATSMLRYDLAKSRSFPIENPYVCDVSILDIRGKTYVSHFEGWWYVEKMLPRTAPRWWNPTTWFRS